MKKPIILIGSGIGAYLIYNSHSEFIRELFGEIIQAGHNLVYILINWFNLINL